MTVGSLARGLDVVIASVSEAIQNREEELDCFVASAPRNDVDHVVPASAPESITPGVDWYRGNRPHAPKRESSPYGSRRGGRDDVGGLFEFIFQTATYAQT
jgi:hypothetical protein